RFKLVFFMPPAALSACKTASSLPAQPTECAFASKGVGQFRPGDGANPHVCSITVLEALEEVRVESICLDRDRHWRSQPKADYGRAHPYEEPAYEVYKMQDL
ncbi:hypothetical protein P171DRAFT_360942, partial [Karstenula rhodostoma CBS 690.94]